MRTTDMSQRRRRALGGALLCAVIVAACQRGAGGRPKVEAGATPGTTVGSPAAVDVGPGDHVIPDPDRDGRLAAAGFGPRWRARGFSHGWNAAHGPGVGVSDCAHQVYGVWDRGRPGLTMPEWRRGMWGWFGRGPSYGSFADWDTSNDLLVDRREFVAAADRYGVFDTWDTDRDGRISRHEYEAGILDGFDGDRDGAVDDPEWRARVERWDGGA